MLVSVCYWKASQGKLKINEPKYIALFAGFFVLDWEERKTFHSTMAKKLSE